MRLSIHITRFLKQSIGERIPEAKIYLFGSRASDDASGGDIDLLIITKEPVDKKIFRSIRIEFFKKFGWQKIDLVNLTDNDQSAFKQIILADAIAL